MEQRSHLIEYSDENETILIYRIDSNDTKEFYTTIKFPKKNSNIDDFIKSLGELLIVDSPVARKKLNL